MKSAKTAKDRLVEDKALMGRLEGLAQVEGAREGEALSMESEEITADEMLRVSHNWKTQPGVRIASSFLAALGMALERGNPDQIEVIKEAFPTEWETWNDEFDPETGRLILDLEEDEGDGADREPENDEECEKDEDGRHRPENGFDMRNHYREM